MVSKSKKEIAGKKKKIKVLNLKKETIKDLANDEAKGIKGADSVVYRNYQKYQTYTCQLSNIQSGGGIISGASY